MPRLSRPLLSALALAATVSAGPATAQETPQLSGCDLAPADYPDFLAVTLAGTWQVQHGTGVMRMAGSNGNVIFPIPADPAPQAAEIKVEPGSGRFLVQTAEMGTPRELVLTDAATEGEFGLGEESLTYMDFDAIAAAGLQPPNCDRALLPLLTYTGPIEDEAGQQAPGTFQVLLHVVTDTLLSGVLVINMTGPDGAQVHARRFISFVRA